MDPVVEAARELRDGSRALDRHAAAMDRQSAAMERFNAIAEELPGRVGQEVRDTSDHLGGVAARHGSGSLALWLLILIVYKLIKKWLGV